jgi:cytochrome c553
LSWETGEKVALDKSIVIKDMTEKDLVIALQDYKKGSRNVHGMGALMKGQTASLSDADMKAIAKEICKK